MNGPLIETSESIAALAKALPAAQKAIAQVQLDQLNDHFGNRYASLSAIARAILPAMNDHGITVLQAVTGQGEVVTVTTRLQHESQEWLQTTHQVPVSRRDAQGIGSALTYARRQALASLLTVAPEGEDDDGEGAVGRGRPAKPPLGEAPPKEPPRSDLATRVARLRKTLADVKILRDLEKAWDLAKALREQLAREDPKEHAALEAYYEQRHHELIAGAG